MEHVEKVIDINAHIEHLSCTITTENGVATAKISFDNLGYGDMTAIKFNACGYNSFGDIVPVNGKDKFFLIIQDFKANKNERVTDLTVKLPNTAIKKLDLIENQICYADGSVLTYEGERSFTFDLEEFNEASEELLALRKTYDSKVKYILKDFENGWVCTCGRFNFLDKSKCSLCENFKSKTVDACSESGRKKAIEDYKKQKEHERENQIIENKRKEKETLKMKIYIAIGLIAVVVIMARIVRSNTLSKRMIFSSEEEMQQALEGRYTYYFEGLHGPEASKQIVIKDGKYKYVYASFEDDDEWFDITYYPNEGKIQTFEELIVTKEGDLQDGDDLFVKSGFKLKGGSDRYSDFDDSSSSYESAYTALTITVDPCYSNGSYTICTGKVTNNGKKNYKFVTVKGSFMDSSGTVLDTDSTYAVGSEGLEPGESSSFRLSVSKDSKIDSCSVSLLDCDF